ncbi:MAG: TonB-dependent receptor [Steroidobacteraceae bacterium]
MTARTKNFSLARPSTVAAAVAAVLAGVSAQAAETPAAATLEEVTVFGHGVSRQVATVSDIDIQEAAPGTSALKVIEKLPGVSFQSADPWGAYEWSTRITVRSFNQNQLGFTLDGVPLGDMSYGNHNGLHISRAISSENISSALLSQGAGALDTASSSNLGGTLQFYSADPAHEFGANVALTGGNASTHRGFIRLESGDLGGYGTRGYLSYTNQKSDKWKGNGEQKQQQINFKVVQPIGDAKLTGFYNWSDRAENDYQDLSLDMLNRLGYNWDNLSDNWPLMVQVAQIYQAGSSAFPAPIKTVDDSYANASGLRKDKLAGLTLNLPFASGASWDTTAYLHKNRGEGVWFTPYVPTPVGAPDGSGGTIGTGANAPISVRTTEYDIDRKGATSAITWEVGNQRVNFGLWYEKNDFNQARRFYGLRLAAPQRDSLEFMKNPFFTQWQYAFETKTTEFYLQDTWKVNDQWKLNFGFKSLDVKNEAKAITDVRFTTSLAGEIKAKKSFLPQVGFVYAPSAETEIFGDVTRNMRAFIAAATGASPFATSPTNFAALKQSGLEPETSTTYEFGWRYKTPNLQAVAAAYFVNFKDRLLANTIGAGIVGNPVVLQNVGDVQNRGVEVGLNWRPKENWTWYNSFTYNVPTYQNDVVSTRIVGGVPVTTVTPTKGKTTVDSPKELFNSELGYDNGAYFGKLGVNYVGRRYFTYLNDSGVPNYTVVNLGAGWHGTAIGVAKKLTVQFNVTNLTGEKYISTIGSNGFNNSGDNQTVLPGAPRQLYLSVSGQF